MNRYIVFTPPLQGAHERFVHDVKERFKRAKSQACLNSSERCVFRAMLKERTTHPTQCYTMCCFVCYKIGLFVLAFHHCGCKDNENSEYPPNVSLRFFCI